MAEGKTSFTVHGLDSETNTDDVADHLAGIDGVMGKTVEADGSVEVLYDEDLLSAERVKKTLREAGYEVE